VKAQKFTILIVDDNDDDRFFLDRMFRKLAGTYRIQLLENGDGAIAYMKGEGEYQDRTRFQFPSYTITGCEDWWMRGLGGRFVVSSLG